MPKIPRDQIPVFQPGQLEAICEVLGETDGGLSGGEIAHVLAQAAVVDTDPAITKRKRLYNALAHRQNSDRHGSTVLQFIRFAMEPARYAGRRSLFDERRHRLNVPLAFVGLQFGEDGRFHRNGRATTLSEAEERANRLRKKLVDRNVHADVLAFCRAELLSDNYFHAVLEATKSVADKIRRKSSADGDGAALVNAALAGGSPVLRINANSTDSERGEQRGFCNLLVGMFGVFRNPTAHAPKVVWQIDEHDALDLMVLASYAHRRLDRSTRT